jgi:hypothetical protein
MRLTAEDYIASEEQLFTFWLLENVILQIFMRNSDQGYLAIIEIQLSVICPETFGSKLHG